MTEGQQGCEKHLLKKREKMNNLNNQNLALNERNTLRVSHQISTSR